MATKRARTERRCQQFEAQARDLRREGKHLEALRKLEEVLVLTRQLQRAPDDESNDADVIDIWRVCRQIAATCNAVAMAFLQQGKEEQCMELLRRAIDLTETPTVEEDDVGRIKLRAVTYNNIGCYHRKMGQPIEALGSLQRALNLLDHIHDAQHAGDTHLNICAMLSQMERHSEALEHAQTALILLQEELYFEQGGSTEGAADEKSKRFGVLAIAYHNVAVEQEYLGRVEECFTSYCKAAELAELKLSPSHPIAVALAASLQNARNTWAGPQGAGDADADADAPRGAARSTARSEHGPDSRTRANKYSRSTTRSAVSRMSLGHPSTRAPVRPKSASHAAIKRREGFAQGVNTTRTARVMAAREAEQLYADNNFESHSPGGQLTMLTPRGQHHHPHEDDGY